VTLQLDHLVVAAASLEQGQSWCEETLGVQSGPGGKHPLMGTHNRLLRIASDAFALAYFEIIAIDPLAPDPGRARWFGLDDPQLQARLRNQGPALVHWVARCDNIEAELAHLRDHGLDGGRPLQAGRDTPHGRLQWQIAVRDDGHVLCGGALPTLIQWGSTHPASQLPESGVTLQQLELRGLPASVSGRLPASISTRQPGHGTTAGLSATLSTWRGAVTLHGLTGD
jgi:hypothetical protein